MKLIGIAGKARSGKDTVAQMLCFEHGFTRIAFADPVKLAAQQMFGLSREQTWNDDLKEVEIPHWGMSPRRMFQLLGTEASKPYFGNDIWIKRFELSYNAVKDTDNIVIPDCRFDPEADWVRAQGGVVIEVRRGTGLVGSAGDHASERGLSSLPDFVIENNGTMQELADKVAEVLK